MNAIPKRRRRGPAIPLGRWFGIEIGADASWLIIFLLVTFSLSSQLAHEHPSWAPMQHWTLGLVTSLLFFASIVLHELGHSLVAIRLGVPVRSITLFIFGGVAALGKEPERPRDELMISLAGPAVSLALAGIFWLGTRAAGPETVVGSSVSWLAQINLVLGLFNMIPGFPLDGGRVLRALIWAWKGDLTRATTVAASAGALVAYGFMAWGLWIALVDHSLFNGLWLGFIGWFLLSAAKSSAAQGLTRRALANVHVADVMDTTFRVVSPALSIRQLVEEGVLRHGQRSFLVGSEGRLGGLLTLHEIREIPAEEWDTTSTQGAMRRLEDLATVKPACGLLDAMRVMDDAEVSQIPVVDEDRLVGVLRRDAVLAVVRNQLEFAR